ncbi:protease inhibitor I42 family protein [bacterium]|nr:protease inhibitor I42 family protein [bacterium]
MKSVMIVLVLLLSIGFTSCRQQLITEKEELKGDTAVTVIDATQSSQKITCQVGKKFTISLEGNPSTGFNWDFEQGFDNELVIFQGTEIKATNQDSNVVGAPSTFLWTFKAIKTGTTEAIMKYKRQWEKDPVNDKTVLVQVTITE